MPALIGRTFDGAPEPAEGSVPQAVISHELWQRRFGGRADVIGRAITLRDGAFQVIGVAPSWFFGETVGQRPDAWLPLANLSTILPGRPWLHDVPGTVEKVMWLHVFGRLRPEATADAAAAEANVTFQQGLTRYYGTLPDPRARQGFLDQRLRVRPAANGANSLSDFADPLWVLLGGAGLVLLIACANLGNLLLARTTARVREVAVRLALGAGRGRLVRQLLTESLCLAIAGGVCGLGLAFALRQALIRLLVDPIVAAGHARPPRAALRVRPHPRGRADAGPAAGAAHHEDAGGHRAARSGARHRRVRRVAADRRAWSWSASSPCRCRCSSAPACWRARSSTCSAPTSAMPRTACSQ